MEMRELEIVTAIADHPHLREAAERLEVTPSALSHALSRIERQLGMKLFERGHSLRPTPAGALYLAYAREMLAIRSQTYRSIASFCSQGREAFSVGPSPHLDMEILIALYDDYQRRWPGVRIDVMESYSREAIERVIARRLDIAIGIQDDALIARSGLRFLPIQRIEYVLIIAEENALAEGGVPSFFDPREIPSRPLSLFRDVPFVANDRRNLSSASFIQSLFRRAGFTPLTINSAGSIPFAKALAVQNNAYAFIPLDSMNGSSGLRCYRLAPPLSVLKGYYFRRDFAVTPAVASFMEMFAAQTKQRYAFSAALHPMPFAIPARYLAPENAQERL